LKRRALGRALCEAKPALLLLAAAVALFAGCGTIPDVRALLHASVLYQDDADFVGARGPLTEEQGQRIIERLEERQQTPSDILQRHLAFEQALSDVPLVVGNKVTPLKNANETYRAMLAAIRNAHDSINIEMYIFSDGPIGKMFADALIERERHGVQVNLAYDSFGSFSTSASFFDRMQQNGIAVLQYRPLNPFEAKLHWTLGHRNHRKMIIVDGGIAFTGGVNISEVYASGLGSRATRVPLEYWRDTDIELQGPVVAEVQRLFISEWNRQQGSPLSQRDYFPKLERQGDQIVRVTPACPSDSV
jgi:cardiolipin synthase